MCSTKEKANITWLQNDNPVDLSVLNITQTTDKKSVLYQRDVASGDAGVRGTLLGPPFKCRAVNDTGGATTTDPFTFRLGSE